MIPFAITLLVAVAGSTVAVRPGLPDDMRLAPVRPRLELLVDRAVREGLPAEMIVSKVREGLAKGVDPARIEAAAVRLTDSLETAQRYVTVRRPESPAPVPLVRAVAEARLAGVALTAIDPLVGPDRAELPVRRAVEVVTDLSLRGYPSDGAAAVVKNVLARDVAGLDRIPLALETLRRDFALSRAEAVDALARGLASAESLQTAYNRTVEDERRRGHGQGAGADRGADGRDGAPGKSGLAPGHLPKMKPPTAGPKNR
jgi:hypothetical protein